MKGADAGAVKGAEGQQVSAREVTVTGGAEIHVEEGGEVDIESGSTSVSQLLRTPVEVKIGRVASWLIAITFAVALIVIGKSYLVPIFTALVVWYLVNALSEQFKRLPFIGRRIPEWVTLGMSLLFIGLSIYLITDSIIETLTDFSQDANSYIPRVNQQIARLYEFARPNLEAPTLQELGVTDMTWVFNTELLSSVTSFARGLLLVLLYVLFFIIEQNTFGKKMRALGLDLDKSNRLSLTLNHINSAMRTYLGVKTVTSLITALLSWGIFVWVGIDYAPFWAFLIFLFNYIPTVGSVVATFLPGMLALVQFETLTPFLIIIIGVTIIQILVGNILEPRMMGNTLNISPLVVVLSLILWSMLWGIIGMLLSVPITVAIIIICSQFPTTRNVAILLSRNGKIDFVPPSVMRSHIEEQRKS